MYLAPQGAPNVDMQSIYVQSSEVRTTFLTKKLKIHWKSVYLAPQRAFYITFSGENGRFCKKNQFLVGNMCNPARRTPGTAEREASVAEMLAREARQPPHAGACAAPGHPIGPTLLTVFPG